MKIAVAVRELPASGRAGRHTGVGRYCADLLEGLRALGHEAQAVGAGAAAGMPGWLTARREIASLRPELLVIGEPGWHSGAAAAAPSAPWAPVIYGTDAVALRPAVQYRGWWPPSRVRRHLLRGYFGRAARLIAISRYAARELEQTTGQGGALVVYPAVGATFTATPPAAEPPEAPFRVLTIGRISERKNQLGTLRALLRLARAEGLEFHFTMAGNVDSDAHAGYASALRNLIASEGATERVTFVERASDAEVAALLDASHVCVALSRAAGSSVEGFGITALEAAARARAVVVSREGGMPEAIEDGVTGFAVDPGDEGAVAAALLRLAREPGLRQRMGAAGRARALGGFTPRHMAVAFMAGLRP